MASEEQSNTNQHRPRLRRPPITGILVLLVIGTASALPLMIDGCNPIKGGGGDSIEPMELWGRWFGMMLASADSATARNMGVPPGVAGVVVVDVARDAASPATQVGIAPGDVIVKVDGTSTQNLAELYTLTTRLSTARPVPLEIMRQGQMASVVLPARMVAPGQQPMAYQASPTPAPQQPAVWSAPQGPALPGQAPAAAQQLPAQPMPPQPAAPAPAGQQPIAQMGAQSALWPVAPQQVPANNGLQAPMGR